MEALGEQAYLAALWQKAFINLHLDSSATLGLTHRKGLGKAKHIEVQHLWLQEATREKKIKFTKIHTDHNPADLLTKPLCEQKIEHFMPGLGYVYLM